MGPIQKYADKIALCNDLYNATVLSLGCQGAGGSGVGGRLASWNGACDHPTGGSQISCQVGISTGYNCCISLVVRPWLH